MHRKISRNAVLLLLLACALPSLLCAADREVLYQVSTLGALQEGVYESAMNLRDLGKHGDLGIGTYEALDGEMILLDGRFYQVRADGKAVLPGPGTGTPFAVVTSFKADRTVPVEEPLDFDRLRKWAATLLPSPNLPYAFRIEGRFKRVKTRSVPRQSKPYPRLVEVVKNQPEFEMKDVQGTIVGFWLPSYLSGINLPGFHLHFIDSSGSRGGHLLEFEMVSGKLMLDRSRKLELLLPEGSGFLDADLRNAAEKELNKIEK